MKYQILISGIVITLIAWCPYRKFDLGDEEPKRRDNGY
jgi:hypothetical protein